MSESIQSTSSRGGGPEQDSIITTDSSNVPSGLASSPPDWRDEEMIVALEADSSTGETSVDESDVSSITTSLASSATAFDFRYEYGRRFHGFSDHKYSLPNDLQEAERLEIQHIIWKRLLHNRLYLAPLGDNMTDALDIGCGTGSWTIEFAEQHPHTSIIGTDLSPIQPEYVPSNCNWLVDDANQPWPASFADRFDFVHARCIGFGVPDWVHVVTQARRALKPGGWLELQEFAMPLGCDDGSAAGSAIAAWGERMAAGSAVLGVNAAASYGLAQQLRDQGFLGVRELRLKCPIGPWARGRLEKEMGVYALRDLYDNLSGLSVKLFSASGWTHEQTEELCEQAKKDILDRKIHMYMPLIVVWGQMPQ